MIIFLVYRSLLLIIAKHRQQKTINTAVNTYNPAEINIISIIIIIIISFGKRWKVFLHENVVYPFDFLGCDGCFHGYVK